VDRYKEISPEKGVIRGLRLLFAQPPKRRHRSGRRWEGIRTKSMDLNRQTPFGMPGRGGILSLDELKGGFGGDKESPGGSTGGREIRERWGMSRVNHNFPGL